MSPKQIFIHKTTWSEYNMEYNWHLLKSILTYVCLVHLTLNIGFIKSMQLKIKISKSNLWRECWVIQSFYSFFVAFLFIKLNVCFFITGLLCWLMLWFCGNKCNLFYKIRALYFSTVIQSLITVHFYISG